MPSTLGFENIMEKKDMALIVERKKEKVPMVLVVDYIKLLECIGAILPFNKDINMDANRWVRFSCPFLIPDYLIMT